MCYLEWGGVVVVVVDCWDEVYFCVFWVWFEFGFYVVDLGVLVGCVGGGWEDCEVVFVVDLFI